MKGIIKALYKKDPKLAKEVVATLGYKITAELTASQKKMAAGIAQTIKALEKFKKDGLSLLKRAPEGGKSAKIASDLIDKLLIQLESYEADQW